MKKKGKKNLRKQDFIKSFVKQMKENERLILENLTSPNFQYHKKTPKEIAEENEKAKKRKGAETLAKTLKPVFSKMSKLVGEYDAKDILHDALGISCDNYYWD